MQTPTRDLHWSLRHKEYVDEFRKIRMRFSATFAKGKEFQGASPGIFVGKHDYPNVNVGFLTTAAYDHHDDVGFWKENHFTIPQIIAKRIDLLNATTKSNVRTAVLEEYTHAVALSDTPVDADITLTKIPAIELHTPADVIPHGPLSSLQHIALTSEPDIDVHVQKAVSDTDMKASDALNYLTRYKDEHFLTQALSSGNLGLGKNRKLVPTRWSITAVDDQLGKSHLERIRSYDVGPTQVFSGAYLGNYCVVIQLEGLWSYELFEMHQSNQTYTTDVESFDGRTEYAEQCAGGYYASRLAVTEYLCAQKKQASVVVLRLITDEYDTPLGVFVFREAMRNAMRSSPIQFNDRNLAIEYARKWFLRKFSYAVDSMLSASKVLAADKQRTLREFV